MKNNALKVHDFILDWGAITVGTFIVAFSVVFFITPSHLAISSITGLAIILSNLIPLPISTLVMIMNIVLLVIGMIFLGKEFGIKTFYTSLLLPVFIGILERVNPENLSLTGDAFVDMVLHCFVVSIGLSMLFNHNASSGGLDIVAKLMNKYLHMDLGKAMILAGICVSVSAIFFYDVKTTMLSILGTYLNGVVLDHFIFGATMRKRVCILSHKDTEILDYVLNTLDCGATTSIARGARTNREYREIEVIVDKNTYRKLMTFISQTDPDAFVTVYTVSEVVSRPRIKISQDTI